MVLLVALIFGILACIAIGFAMYFRGKMSSFEYQAGDAHAFQEAARLEGEIATLQRRLGEITRELQSEISEKDQLVGKGKQLFIEMTELRAKYDLLALEKEKIGHELVQFQTEAQRRQDDFDKRVMQLDDARTALEDEKKRIRREDEEQLQAARDNRDRTWAEHEERVKSKLSDLARSPQYHFTYFDNKHLPDNFTGKLKPDCMIEFLGQYVIFDAKVSRSDNLQNYLTDNVKKTAEKLQGNATIYPVVFFIVPIEAISTLTKTHFQEGGYEFFIVAAEALPVIFSSLKRISTYELAEQMDPRERENIITLIAEFDHHINLRNAMDIIASQTGISVLSKIHQLGRNVQSEVAVKKNKIRISSPSPADLKTLMLDIDQQQHHIHEILSPQAAIPEDISTIVRSSLQS